MNADKHFPASSAWSTKRRVRGDASASGSLQLPLTDREATAFMSKQRSGLRMSALQTCQEKQQPSFMNKKVNISEPLKILGFLKLFLGFLESV